MSFLWRRREPPCTNEVCPHTRHSLTFLPTNPTRGLCLNVTEKSLTRGTLFFKRR